MRHNQLTMIAPLEANRRKPLVKFLEEEIGYQRANRPANDLLKTITELHFISMFTFVPPGAGGNREGYLVIEASFDGEVDAFLQRFTTTFDPLLNIILNHCTRHPNESPTAFIRRHSYNPECFYVSCPGLTRQQIDHERELLARLQAEAATLVREGGFAYRDCDTVVAHMRKAARNGGFLESPSEPIPFPVKYGQTIVHLIPLILIALVVLAIGYCPLLAVILGLAVVAVIYQLASTKTESLAKPMVPLTLLALASAAGAAVISQFLPSAIIVVARCTLLVLFVAFGFVALGLWQIERLERHDPIDPGWIDVARMREVCKDENSEGCMQNHFINLSEVKPGALRRWALRLALWVVHYAGIVYFNRGKLGGIPSIHFARWVMLDEKEFGQPLLLFMTNYDASWDSYLGDFVDKASQGASAIWSNTGGFPRTWGVIVAGGSRLEKQFKAYARSGQQCSSAWFSAYPNLSVPQKLNNAKVRRALDKPNLDVGAQDELLRYL